jgi:hypothetical protein
MNTQKTAKRFGVPNPETCQELANHNDFSTLFYWYKNENGDYEIDYTENVEFEHLETMLKAPQMHEIATELPKSIDSYLLMTYNDLIAYENPANEILISSKIENNHYAETYAQLFLKLKKENLI